MGHTDTILIVDDDRQMLEALRLLLETEGYEVASASDGREALAMLVSGLRPCVIIMDLSMPVMNAIEFRRAQLDQPDTAGIPFIAYSGVLDVRRAHELRATAYVEKPTEFEYVLSIISRHCNH